MSSLGGTAPSERPERSRNAKAQARHRAKRKAYIDQLEQTVTKLQSQMGLSPDQISVLPPPMMKIRELEQENGRLLKENEELRRMLQEQAGGRPLDLSRRPLSNDTRNGERDYKRRKPDMDDHPYLSHASSMNDLRPPPPLTIPNGSSYGHVSSHNPTASSTALYGMNGGGGGGTHFQLPNTPSGSSSTSSPPFSASTIPSSSLHACPSGCARRIFDPSNVLFFLHPCSQTCIPRHIRLRTTATAPITRRSRWKTTHIRTPIQIHTRARYRRSTITLVVRPITDSTVGTPILPNV